VDAVAALRGTSRKLWGTRSIAEVISSSEGCDSRFRSSKGTPTTSAVSSSSSGSSGVEVDGGVTGTIAGTGRPSESSRVAGWWCVTAETTGIVPVGSRPNREAGACPVEGTGSGSGADGAEGASSSTSRGGSSASSAFRRTNSAVRFWRAGSSQAEASGLVKIVRRASRWLTIAIRAST